MLDPLSRTVPHAREGLLTAYELRARAQFSLNKAADARANFEALLRRSPTYTLSDQVSPRVLKLFDDVRNAVTGRIVLICRSPTPRSRSTASRSSPGPKPLTLAEGAHTVTAARPGYAPLTQPFAVAPGPTTVEVPVTLERVSALLAINTVPAGVEVSLNGVVRGTTEPAGAADRRPSATNVGPAGLVEDDGAVRSAGGVHHARVQARLLRAAAAAHQRRRSWPTCASRSSSSSPPWRLSTSR